eukprot:6214368-Pleurochrysis_carterae.AAC.3
MNRLSAQQCAPPRCAYLPPSPHARSYPCEDGILSRHTFRASSKKARSCTAERHPDTRRSAPTASRVSAK